ncbi:hypothetical protein B0F90DRAFT_1215752 [Multifurca ochricompacta]|uniref:Uncharacterized protein n=1 Tax=Multifurca ochricompacta TaxID=376703 RepID=A0AAD4LZZ1_9AGAM|nr:hypothetical protein B0F90DRAFT_1215752 [Multifurca ochricompacta]
MPSRPKKRAGKRSHHDRDLSQPRGMSNPSSRQDEVRDESVLETSKVELAVSGYPDSELIEDTISDEEHRRLDNLDLVSTLSALFHQFDSIALPLLQIIVTDCNQLDQKYNKEASQSEELIRDLFKAHPWLVPFLGKCRDRRSFRDTRRLKIYDPPPLIPPQNKGVATSLQVPIRQFKLPYVRGVPLSKAMPQLHFFSRSRVTSTSGEMSTPGRLV